MSELPEQRAESSSASLHPAASAPATVPFFVTRDDLGQLREQFARMKEELEGSVASTYQQAWAGVADVRRKLNELHARQEAAHRTSAVHPGVQPAGNLGVPRQHEPARLTVKPPSPGMFDGKPSGRDVQWWTFQAGAYLQSLGMDKGKPGIAHISRFFDEGVLKWWRMELERERLGYVSYDDWDDLKSALETKYMDKNHRLNMRERLRSCVQKSSVRTYNDDFNEIIMEFPYRSEIDQLDDYIDGLK